jgi:hypothetical protein
MPWSSSYCCSPCHVLHASMACKQAVHGMEYTLWGGRPWHGDSKQKGEDAMETTVHGMEYHGPCHGGIGGTYPSMPWTTYGTCHVLLLLHAMYSSTLLQVECPTLTPPRVWCSGQVSAKVQLRHLCSPRKIKMITAMSSHLSLALGPTAYLTKAQHPRDITSPSTRAPCGNVCIAFPQPTSNTLVPRITYHGTL